MIGKKIILFRNLELKNIPTEDIKIKKSINDIKWAGLWTFWVGLLNFTTSILFTFVLVFFYNDEISGMIFLLILVPGVLISGYLMSSGLMIRNFVSGVRTQKTLLTINTVIFIFLSLSVTGFIGAVMSIGALLRYKYFEQSIKNKNISTKNIFIDITDIFKIDNIS
jgi:hypothetical protein